MVSAFGQASVGGTMNSSDTSKCVTGNSGSIQLTGYTGNILRWEYSYSGGDPWTPIAHTSAIYNFTNLTQSVSFRAVVQVPANLPATSSVIRVNVYDSSLGGALSGTTSVCSGSVYPYQLTGSRGAIQDWEISTNGGAIWNPIPSSNDSLIKHLSFSSASLLRIEVKNGACPLIYSNTVSVSSFSPTVSGSISGTDSVCISGNTVSLNLAGQTATSMIWETSAQPSGPWIPLGSGSNFSTNNLVANAYYRVVAQNGGCPTATTGVYPVVVSNISAGGTISGDAILCAGDSVQLALVNYTGSILNWEQSFNNGSSWSAIATTSDQYMSSAQTISSWFRTVVKNGVCPPVNSGNKVIAVQALPAPSFGFSNSCMNVPVTFTNTTPGSNTYLWNMGDGTGNTVTNPIHVFNSNGSYVVKLTATNTAGCLDSISQTIAIYAQPEADFTVADTICLGDLVQFTDQTTLSQGTITAYSWNFSGLGQAASQNPVFSQLVAGSNLVDFKVTSSLGCHDSITKTIVVRDKPVAGFDVGNACFGTAMDLQNTSYTAGAIPSYSWNFGDGNTSSVTNPSHIYAAQGNYNIMLITSNAYGCSDTLIQSINVHPVPQIDFTQINVCFSDSMYFIPQISNVSNYAVDWNFGDGQTSALFAPAHYYGNYGVYQAELSVTSDSGCVATMIKNVEVFPLPAASYFVQNGCELDAITFQNFSAIPLGTMTYAWDFGNNTTATDQHPSIIYSSENVYPIQLIVTSNNGCTDTTTSNLTVFDKPLASFATANVCYGVPVNFSNTSTVSFGSISDVIWDFGDNTNSSLNNPVKEYLNSGDYTVELIVTSTNGCSDTTDQLISVFDAPIANFTALNECFGTATTFNNTTTIGAGSFTSSWDYGNGVTSTEFAPQYLYEDAGIYPVELVIVSDFGCADSITKPVVIYYLPAVDAGDNVSTDKGYAVELTAVGGINFVWTPSQGLSSPSTAETMSNPDETTLYTVTVEDNNGCFGTDSVLVTVTNSFKIKPFNILTPDGNNQNDTWIVENIESYPANTIVILNELGHEVYRADSYANTWDGRNKTGEILPDGTYYYIISFAGSDKHYKGDLLLIRNQE
jgi:gliding motility-associated-like protein